ncbi:MAG: Ig-like domain-containing protein [Erysipelotrichaceae bacterium]|nr:Ig-like domain-containing protein [Erysipelotrichaceae bacterium]
MRKNIIKSIIISLAIILISVLLVPVSAATIKLNHKSYKMYPKQTITLTVKGTSKTVKWSSSKKSVASVDQSGVVTAKKSGSCKIYAKVAGKKLTCKITVKSTKTYAKELRKYLLKKKKYTLTKTYIDDETQEEFKVSIKANKKNNKLVFSFEDRPDAPADVLRFEMTIDLQSSKAGTFITHFQDAYEDAYEETRGTITKAYTTYGDGVTFTDAFYMSSDDESSSPSEASIKNRASCIMEEGFYYFNKVIKSKKGLTMNMIGFTQY